jgi:Mg2+ and Co2+ transporter CorA
VTHIAYGDVEHFRPKGGYRQSADDPLGKPGYYWLAYEWSNLFFACQLCNQRFKKNLFPLQDAARRAISHNDDLNDEEILFIHLEETDPAEHIAYRNEYCFTIEDSERGTASITALGLNREELVEVRRDRLTTWRQLKNVRELIAAYIQDRNTASEPIPPEFSDQLEELDAEIERLHRQTAEYSAMARAFFDAADD